MDELSATNELKQSCVVPGLLGQICVLKLSVCWNGFDAASSRSACVAVDPVMKRKYLIG